MGDFAYTAVTSSGQRVRRRASAKNVGALQKRLECEGLIVLGIRPAGSSKAWRRHGSHDETLLYLRAAHSLLCAGTPASDALRAAADLVPPRFRTNAEEILGAVSRGRSISTAMAEYPRNFSPVVVAMIAAGEESGQLAEAFKASLSHMEREAAFRARVISALIYPAILAFAGTAALSVLVLFVLPRFAELILAGGGRLPALPMLMLTAASAVQRYWPALLALVILLSTAAAGALTSPERRLTVSRLSFAIPLIGNTRRMIAGAQFARALGMLVAGGTPIVHALDRTAAATRDPSVRSAIEVVRDRVRAGHAFSDAARRSGFIPLLGAQLIGIGERSGDLSGHLLHAADILEGDLERRISRLLTLVEPAMIVIFGAIIGLTALGLMQAVYGVHGGVLK